MGLNLRRPNTRRIVWMSLTGLLLAMAAYQVFGSNGLLALRRQLQEERQWQQRNETLRRGNQALQKRIHELRTDPKTIERIAREELMLADPAERIILTPQKK